MNIEQLIADLRARVNPQYYDQVGTESYERNQCVLALEYLATENERLKELMAKRTREHQQEMTSFRLRVRSQDDATFAALRDEVNGLTGSLDRAEKALKEAQEQKPALYMAFSECGQFIRYWTRDTANLDATMAVNDFTVLEFFARPTPATAAPTDEQIHAAYRTALGQSIRERDMPEIRKFANELLQSADHSELAIEKVAPDCQTCANRGQVNGLSQESYCDSCIYQGRDWRKNHFVDASKMADAVKRRCDACAVLPCSCE